MLSFAQVGTSHPSACFPGFRRWRHHGAGGPGPALPPVLAGAGRGLAEPPAAAALGPVQLPAGESVRGPPAASPVREPTLTRGEEAQLPPGAGVGSTGSAELVAGLRGGFGGALKVCEGAFRVPCAVHPTGPCPLAAADSVWETEGGGEGCQSVGRTGGPRGSWGGVFWGTSVGFSSPPGHASNPLCGLGHQGPIPEAPQGRGPGGRLCTHSADGCSCHQLHPCLPLGPLLHLLRRENREPPGFQRARGSSPEV